MISVFHKRFIRPGKCNVIRFLFTLLLLQFAGIFLLFHKQNMFNQSVSSPLCCASNVCENPCWKMKPLNNMTLEDVLNYLKWSNSSSCSVAHDFGGVVYKPTGIDGQKAICLDDSVKPVFTSAGNAVNQSAECLVYSFGISNEWSFDEAMERFGCRVFSFDPSMNNGPHNHSEKIYFYNVGLDTHDRILVKKDKFHGTVNWTVMSLDSIYRNLLKHEGRIIDYLKIDIEQKEWDVLPQILSSGMMDNVRQLGVELHLFPDKFHCKLEDIRKRVKIIQSMEDYGLVRFDSKQNLWSPGWRIIENVKWLGYCAYEIAWYNSKIIRAPL